jgi:hypothetical protein
MKVMPWRRFLQCVIAAASLPCAFTGCNIVGPAAYILEGPPTIEARHTLLNVPTLVFIDDRSSQVSPVSLRRVIADKASENLMVKKVVTTMISPQDAMNMASQLERNSKLLPIEEIGRKVGAKQVIYVEMEQFSDRSGLVPQPMAVCRVRVIDVENRVRTFPPADSQENSVVVQVRPREADPDLYASRAGQIKVRQALATDTGDQIAKLFYKHERKDLGGSLNPR